MVYSSGLENRQAERLREFESLPLRHDSADLPLGKTDESLRREYDWTASSEFTSVKRASAVYSSRIAVGYT